MRATATTEALSLGDRRTVAADFGETVYGAMEIREDPYPFYDYLRHECPVYQIPGREEYILSRWADIVEASRQPDVFASSQTRPQKEAEPLAGVRYPIAAGIPGQDPPHHTAMRRLIFDLVLSPRRVKTYEPLIQQEVDHLVDGFGDDREIEFQSRFAAWLPTRVIGRILGVGPEHSRKFKEWSDNYILLVDDFYAREERPRLLASLVEFSNFCGDLIAERRSHPRDDLATQIALAVDADGRPFPVDELANQLRTLIHAAGDSTLYTLTTVMCEILRTQGRGDPTDVKYAYRVVDEVLRKESVVAWSPRRCTRDVEIHGVVIPEGARVMLMWGSGGRDETRFDRPHDFDPNRSGLKDNLGFGHGPHFCAGAPLARAEIAITLRTLFTRYPAVRLADRNTYRHLMTTQIRGYTELYLELEPDSWQPVPDCAHADTNSHEWRREPEMASIDRGLNLSRTDGTVRDRRNCGAPAERPT